MWHNSEIQPKEARVTLSIIYQPELPTYCSTLCPGQAVREPKVCGAPSSWLQLHSPFLDLIFPPVSKFRFAPRASANSHRCSLWDLA